MANSTLNFVTKKDIEYLEAYNAAVRNGVNPMSAYYRTMMGASNAAKELVTNANGAEVDITAASTAMKGYTTSTVGAKIATVALQTALSFGLAIAIQLIITLFQKLSEALPTIENTSKRLEESSRKVKDIKNKIDDLNNELKTSQDRLNELLSKDSPTIIEQEEVDRLRAANSELEREIKLQKAALESKQTENSKNFQDNVMATATHKPTDDVPLWAQMLGGAFTGTFFSLWELGSDNASEKFANQTASYKTFVTQISDLQKQISDAIDNGASDEELKSLQSRLEMLKNYRDSYRSEMEAYVTTLREAREKLGDVDYSTLPDETKQWLDYIQDVENRFLALDDDNFDEVLQNIFNSERFKDAKAIVDELKNSGKLTGDALKELYDSGNAGVIQLIDNMKSVGLINDTTAESFQKVANHIIGVKEAAEEVESSRGIATFQQLMEAKGTDKDPSFIERIEKTVEQFQKLEDALVKFESGSLKDSEKMSLFKTFPQLTAYADNLGEGIRNLLGSMRTNVLSEFSKQLERLKAAGATDEDISKLEAFKNTILNIADSVDSLKNTLDSVRNVFNDLDEIVKDYNENQYFSIESLEKLGESDQRYLSYLTYENNQLKVNEEAYKKLVLAQIDEIETKATLQATTDLQSLTDETTAKEYLAKVNIDLAQSQLSAAQAAFQYALALKMAEGGNVALAAQKVANNLNSLRNIFASAREQANNYSYAMLGAKSATEKKAQASEKAKKALEAEQHALEHSKKALEDEKKALEENKKAYEKAQKAIEDLIEWTQKYIKQLKNDEIESLEKKKEKFDELIEKQKEALQAEKDLHEFEKSLSDKQGTVASNALNAAITGLDDSSAGKKAHKKALDEYKESETDLREFLYDHEIDTRTKALDQLKEDTDKAYDEQIKALQDYLNDEVQLYRDACSMIDNDNGELYGNLLNYCLKYTTTGKTEFDRMWSLAQSAMEKYNVASVGTMQFMDELKGRIYDIDDAVDVLSQNIQTYESRLTDVKNRLDDLKDAAIEAKNAIDAANSTPLTPQKGDTSFWVDYNGKRYTTGYNYNGDTEASRLLAASELVKEIAKDINGFDNYGLGIVQSLLGVGGNKTGHHWTYAFNGKTYESRAATRDDAINDILRQITRAFGGVYPAGASSIYGAIKGYASGTNNASGGVSLVGERGAELRVLNRGDGILNNKIVRGLTALGTNPAQFLAEAGQKMLATLFGNRMKPNFGIINKDSTISPSISIVVQGDATQSTLNALEIYAKKISNDTIRRIQSETLRRTYSSRVR